uniref:Uncharacterized protein n=1 Tax=Rhizophora mucronata TaxID=61149 RepID=A0A2P2QZU9_RHIMU
MYSADLSRYLQKEGGIYCIIQQELQLSAMKK